MAFALPFKDDIAYSSMITWTKKAEFALFRWKRSIELLGPVPAGVRALSINQGWMAILVGHWSTTESAASKARFESADRALLQTNLPATHCYLQKAFPY